MKNLYIYRVYDTGKGGKHCSESFLERQLCTNVENSWVMAFERAGDEGYVLLGYEADKELGPEEAKEQFNKITMQVGNLSDKIGYELTIEFMMYVAGTVVTPDSLAKPAKTEEAPVKPKEDEYDEWADVKRLRDIGKH